MADIKKLLVTGGLGFIGSNFIRFQLENYEGVHIVNLDKITYAGNPLNLANLANHPRYRFVKGDICDGETVDKVIEEGIDAVVNFAAESHVDRSIISVEPFLRTNITGAQVLLDAVRKHEVTRFLQISTDEVYGSIPHPHSSKEDDKLLPNSPYAVSKASADLLARAYFITYGTPILITRSSNNYGRYQFPEKLIPVMITKALEDEPLPVYGDGMNVRDWIHVEDNCKAIDLVLRKGRLGEIYNIGGGVEIPNLHLVKLILKIMGKPESLLTFVPDRPGHDKRYSLNCEKLRDEFGWRPHINFEEGLRSTINWYVENRSWLEAIRCGTYQQGY